MKQFLITMAGVVAGLFLFFVGSFLLVGFAVATSVSSVSQPTGFVASSVVLELDLRAPLSDQAEASSFGFNTPISLIGVIDALHRAESDYRVMGLFVRANEYGMAPAQAEELHQAFLAFRESGRFVIAHAQGFEGTSIMSYVSASAADEIWMQGSANFVATGLATHTAFLGGLFEHFEAIPQFVQFAEYKNAANTYTETTYTDAHREALTSLLDGLFDDAVTRSAAGRGMTDTGLHTLVEAGPYSAEEALGHGLVDHLGHVVDAREAALERAGKDASLQSVSSYLSAAGGANRSGPMIALVGGQGAIITGEERSNPFGGSDGFYSDTVADAILDAADDDRVRAIVFRIDSPGGSAIASDQILDAVERAREDGLPVVASFASLAASGGYYVAAGADAIFAQPTTITGSIGVLGGKIVFRDTYGLVDLNVEPLAVGGDYTLAYSDAQPFTPQQFAAYRAMMSDIYDDFTGLVAQGRGLPIETVRDIARGRVWTGTQALERGLVDELGGLRDAIDYATVLAGLEEDADVTVQRFPAPLSTIEQLQEFLGVSVEGVQAAAELNALLQTPEIQALIQARQSVDGDAQLRADIPDIR